MRIVNLFDTQLTAPIEHFRFLEPLYKLSRYD